MSYKKKENLNARPYWERSYAKKQKYKNHEDFHYRGEIKIAGKETDMQECKECHRILPLGAFTTHDLRADGVYHVRKICRECHTTIHGEQVAARKNAPPKSEVCDCCHENKKLEIDHTHGTTNVRGWLCTKCNSGIGALGDTLEGVLRAAVYLEKDKSKIIEVLNGIKNEKT